MKEESLSKELERKRTELVDFYKSLDQDDSVMVSNKAKELYTDNAQIDAFINGYMYSKEQPSAYVIHMVAMYVFDYIKSKANYHNIIKNIYKLFREVLPTLKTK